MRVTSDFQSLPRQGSESGVDKLDTSQLAEEDFRLVAI